MKYLIVSLLSLFTYQFLAQNGGMWMPNLIEANIKNMQKAGLKLKAKDLYNPQKTSIKDAIIHFDNGCTAELVSPKGLILTNHHCGYDNIQAHSTLENNLLEKGFWAKDKQGELINEKLTAKIIVDIKDVSIEILKNINTNMSEAERQKIIDNNIKNYLATVPKETWQEVEIKSFYNGNAYYCYTQEVFRDVRLVGAPPSAIGKYGSDTDNWMWPRHTGDFSVFRIYADKNNHPAAYSPDNIPYVPKHFLPINTKGLKEGDYTMVYGFPGRTDEYLSSYAVNQLVEKINPARIKIRETALEILDREMRKNEETKIKYAAQYAGTANYWKKWIGENKGLKQAQAVNKKQFFEQKIIQHNPKVKALLDQLQEHYQKQETYAVGQTLYDEVLRRNSISFKIAHKLNEIIDYSLLDEAKALQKLPEAKAYLERLTTDYDPVIEAEISLAIYAQYQALMPKELTLPQMILTQENILQSIVSQPDLLSLLNQPLTTIVERLKEDYFLKQVAQLNTHYYQNIKPKYDENLAKILPLQRQYMQEQRNYNPNLFPDANSTLRLTYGQIKGYQPSDAVYYAPFTNIEGVMQKYKPKDYEFDLPTRYLELYQKKQYGNYTTQTGDLPVAFIATNHTTGGNSGAPALDAKGQLVGINFDRVWEGTMSDIYYDATICRNVMVDIRYVLWTIDVYGQAGYLLDEMKIIH